MYFFTREYYGFGRDFFSINFFTSAGLNVSILLLASSTNFCEDLMFIEVEYKLIYIFDQNEKNRKK